MGRVFFEELHKCMVFYEELLLGQCYNCNDNTPVTIMIVKKTLCPE